MADSTTSTPRAAPVVLLKEKEAYALWLSILRDFPKLERFGIGQKIDVTFLHLLERTYRASYLPIKPKIEELASVISTLDILKFLMQGSWELKLIGMDKYTQVSILLEKIGQMLFGWRKGLVSKASVKPESKLPQPTK